MISKEYNVKFINSIKIDFSNNQWNVPWYQAECLNDFRNPWNSEGNLYTEFRALWDLEYLYFKFDSVDNSIYINEEDITYESIRGSDRDEIFFRKNKDLLPYYCVEIDSKARIMDFKAKPHKDFDFGWSFPKEHLKVKSYVTRTGYSVEGAFSIKFLKSLNLIHNGIIETGIFRAKFTKQEGLEYKPIWITWIDPQTRTPDFHIPSSFGIINLEKWKI